MSGERDTTGNYDDRKNTSAESMSSVWEAEGIKGYVHTHCAIIRNQYEAVGEW